MTDGRQNKQRKWLDIVRRMDTTGFPFRLCGAQKDGPGRGRPGYWRLWNEWRWDWNPVAEFRTVCQNELLVDMDIDNPDDLYMTTLLVVERLKMHGIPHYIYDSGGKGYHIQVWLDAPTTDTRDWFAIRHHTARWLLKDFMFKDQKNHWNIDPRKWNWVTPMEKDGNFRGKGSVVRAEGGKKRGFKVLIDEIPSPEKRRIKTRPEYPEMEEFKTWKVSDEIIEAVKKQPARRESVSPLSLKDDFDDTLIPICIVDLMERQLDGEHLEHAQRVAMVAYMFAYYKERDGKLTETAFEKLVDIFRNDPNFSEDITRYQVNNIANALNNEPERLPRCNYLRSAVVDKELCQICRIMVKSQRGTK